MKLEEAKKKLNYHKQVLIVADETGTKNDLVESIETVLQALEELEIKNRGRIIGKYGDITLDEILKDKYISKDKVKENIEKLNNEARIHKDETILTIIEREKLVLRNLLEDK